MYQELLQGKYPIIFRLFKSIFIGTLPKPILLFIWAGEQVIRCIDSGKENDAVGNNNLILKSKSLTLCSIQISSEIVQSDTKNMFDNISQFTFGKEWRAKLFKVRITLKVTI